MRSKFFIIFFLIMFLSWFFNIFAIGNKEMNIPVSGNIIYAISGGIYSISLKNINKNIITVNYKKPQNFGVTVLRKQGQTVFSGLSKVNNDKFLFVQEADIRGEIGFVIKEFNRKTKQVRTLREGEAPIYMQKYHKLLFFDDGLEIADINDPIKTAEKITDAGKTERAIIPVSDSEVIFIKEDTSAANDVWRYNLVTNNLEKLSVKRCTFPLLWVDKTEQLICGDRSIGSDRASGRYILTDLQGNIERELSFGKDTEPVIYVQGSSKLILKITDIVNSDEVYNLWMYDLDTGEKQIISKNNGFNLGDGIYYPD